MTDDTTAAAVQAAAEALALRDDGSTDPLDVAAWMPDAEAAVTAAAPILLAPVEAEVERVRRTERFLRDYIDRLVSGDEPAAARRRIAAALALHEPEGAFCPECDVLQPCATYRALTDTGDDATGTGSMCDSCGCRVGDTCKAIAEVETST